MKNTLDWSEDEVPEVPKSLKRKPIALKDKRETVYWAVILAALVLTAMVALGTMFGSEAEQMQAVDKLFTR